MKTRIRSTNSSRAFVALLLGLLLAALSPANAAIKDWVGGGTDGNIGTAGNWSPGGPGSGDIARWNSVAFTRQMNVNGNWGMGELYFAATQNNPVTFGTGSSQLQVYGVSGIGIQMDANSAAVNTGSAKFRLYGNQSWINNSANTLTEGGTIDSNTGGYTLTNDGTGSIVINGWIANGLGTTAVVKNGSGSLTLTGSGSTFAGGLTLNAGTLNINNAGALGGGSVTINGGTLDNTSAGNITISTANTYYFGTNFAWVGTKALTLGAANTVNLTTHCTITNTTAGNWLILNGPVNGAYSLTRDGIGAMVMSGAGNYSGGTIQKGTTASGGLYLGADNPLGTGTLSISNNSTICSDSTTARSLTNAVVFANWQILGNSGQNGALTFSGPVDMAGVQQQLTINSPVTFSGAIGNGGLTKAGSSTLTLSGTNNYALATTINAGTLALGANGYITNSASIVVASNAVFNVSARSTPFALALGLGSQVLSNSAPGAIINGTNNCSAGTLSLVYDGVTPSFIMTNGGMTLSSATGFKINNTGTALGAGTYLIISNVTAGTVGLVAGTAPSSVTVTGGGLVTGCTASLQIASAGLNLLVSKGNQTIGFTNGATLTKTYGNTGFADGATNSSGLTLAYASDNTGVATVDGSGNVTIVAAGSCHIVATNSGSAGYNPASAAQALTVNPLAVGLSGTRAFDGTTNVVYGILAVTNKVGADTVTVASGSAGLAGKDVGTQAITSFSSLTLGNNPAGNYTLAGAIGSVVITNATTTISLISSSQTNGYRSSVNYTSTLPAFASGNVIFRAGTGAFSTNGITNGIAYSLSVTNLPRGTNIITAEFMGDANVLGSTNTLNQIVTNHPPSANVMTVARTAGLALMIALSDVATNWTDNPDGDHISLTSVTMQSTNGVNLFPLNWSTNLDGSIVTTNAYAFIGYTNSPNVNDQINYSISDGQGHRPRSNSHRRSLSSPPPNSSGSQRPGLGISGALLSGCLHR